MSTKHKRVPVTVSTAAVENGEADASAVETWEQKGEPDEEEPGGGSPPDTGFCGDEAQDEMMEEDEEMPTPKLPPPPPDAPKKEHVNVVFIGHVGMLTCLWYHLVLKYTFFYLFITMPACIVIIVYVIRIFHLIYCLIYVFFCTDAGKSTIGGQIM